MTTSFGLHEDTLAQEERAREAVRQARRFLREWTAIARMLSRNSKIKVELTSGGTSCTDGKTIFIRVPPALANVPEHEDALHGQRDEHGILRCKACDIMEDVSITVIHEVAHIINETFEEVTRHDRLNLLARAVEAEAAGNPQSKRAAILAEAVRNAPDERKRDYLNLSSIISPWMPFLINACEDIRVNTKTQQDRPGTREMFQAQTAKVLREGVERYDGSMALWRDQKPNLQAAMGIYCKVGGYSLQDAILPDIAEALDDPALNDICEQMQNAKSMRQVYLLTFPLLENLRRLGFMLAPEDPPDDPPESEPDDSADEQEQEQDDDGQPEGEPSDDDSDDGEPAPGEGDGDGGSSSEDEADGSGGNDSDQADGEDEGGSSDTGDPAPGEGDEAPGDSDSSPGDGSDDSEEEAGAEGEPSEDASPDGGDEEASSSDAEGSGASGGDSQGGDRSEQRDDSQEQDDEAPSDATDPSVAPDDDGTPADDTAEDAPGSPASESVADGTGDDDGGADSDGKDTAEDGDEPARQYTEDDLEEDGTPEEVEHLFRVFGGHEQQSASPSEAIEEQLDEKAIDRALQQIDYFDSPSLRVEGVGEYSYTDPDKHRAWRGQWAVSSSEMKVPERVLSPSIARLRLVFTENAAGKMLTNLRSGKINGRSLAQRVPVGDDRIFRKKIEPGKRDYFVLLGLDCSGSTSDKTSYGVRLDLMKLSVAAMAEMLSRLGINFAVYAHSGGRAKLEIFKIKTSEQPWGRIQKEALAALQPYSANLDGHTLEYYRKVVERRTESDRLILYYTDGAMPAANFAEELEILQREIKNCKMRRIHLVGIGVDSDSPLEHGLDTLLMSDISDIPTVVKGLQKRLV